MHCALREPRAVLIGAAPHRALRPNTTFRPSGAMRHATGPPRFPRGGEPPNGRRSRKVDAAFRVLGRASADTSRPHEKTAEDSVAKDGLDRVLRAARVEPADDVRSSVEPRPESLLPQFDDDQRHEKASEAHQPVLVTTCSS